MRIFYALTFNQKSKEKIFNIQKEFKKLVDRGSFTDKNNYHLTLEFIGQVAPEELINYERILKNLSTNLRFLKSDTIKSFKRGDKEIVWMNIKKEEKLSKLQSELSKKLEKINFKSQYSDYLPHITLGRRIRREKRRDIKLDKIMNLELSSIALMESTRKNNKLVYLPIDKIKF